MVNKKQQKRSKNRRGQKRNSWTNISNSPWRRITFTAGFKGDVGGWLHITNDQAALALIRHLGFTPNTAKYLEVRYFTVSVRRMQEGTGIALRTYRIESSYIADSESVMRSVESWPRTAVSYPVATLQFDQVSKTTPLKSDEPQKLIAVYQHLGQDDEFQVKFTCMYRHAERPFEDEDAFRCIQL